MAKNDWLHLELGFALELKKAGSAIRSYAYTEFGGGGLKVDDTSEGSNYFTKFPAESAAREKFVSCLRASRKAAVSLATGEKRRLLQGIAIPDIG